MAGRAVVPGADAPTEADHGPDAGFYARALADPQFRARFEAAYSGDDDPLDALWWLDRPGEAAPSGAPAPAARAAAARLALYGPGTDPAAVARYEQAAAVAERSRRAAVAALGRMPAEPAPGPAAGAPPVLPRLAAPAAARRRRLPPPVAALALLVLVAAAYAAGRATVATPPPPPLVEHFQQTVTGNRATAVFERAPEAADLLGGDLEPVDPVNLRRLVTIGTVRFLAARTRGDAPAICLVVAEGTNSVAARCVSEAEFDRAGVVLAPKDGLPSAFARVRWEADGKFVWWSPPD